MQHNSEKEITLYPFMLARRLQTEECTGFNVQISSTRLMKTKKIAKSLCYSIKIRIFAVSFLNAESPWVITGGRDTYIQRRFLNALGLTCWNLANSNYLSKTKQRERPLRCNYCTHHSMVGYDIYIGVGLSALLGLTDRAMREPQHVGLGTGLAPRFLCVCRNR